MAKTKNNSNSTIKFKTLFDHVNQIRNVKNQEYFKGLSDQDKKSFNHYMICRFLSMDSRCIYEASYLSKIFDKMDSESFYKVCCALILPTKFTPYIKSKNKKFHSRLLELVGKKYEISTTTSNEYCEMLISSGHEEELRQICSNFGLTEKEIDKIVTKDEN